MGRFTGFDTDNRGRKSAPGFLRQAGERKGYNMTMKEKLEVHRRIEAENRRKLEEFKKGGKAA